MLAIRRWGGNRVRKPEKRDPRGTRGVGLIREIGGLGFGSRRDRVTLSGVKAEDRKYEPENTPPSCDQQTSSAIQHKLKSVAYCKYYIYAECYPAPVESY